MADKFIRLTPEIYDYVVAHRSERDPVLAELAEETAKLGGLSLMQIAAEQGALMALLVRATGARSALEIGTFTGYSALCVARGLPADGRLLCCDVNEEWTSIGRRYWAKAGVDQKIELRLGPALDTLRALPPSAEFDFVFIDADKENYVNYYEAILPRLRPNGLILFDNVLWMGQVVSGSDDDANTRALRALNERVLADRRVESVMLPIADGLTIARKRAPGEK
jgi:caffeoyl-CoA O-methyltransferase